VEGEGVDTLVMVRFCTDAACPSPEEPALKATIQVVAPYAAPPARIVPAATEMTLRPLEKPRDRRCRPALFADIALAADPGT